MRESIFRRLLSTEEGQRAYNREDLIFQVTQLICTIMKEKNITRKELADLAGVTKGHITQLLTGNHNMTLATIADLFHALGCKVTLGVSPSRASNFTDAVVCPQNGEWESTATAWIETAEQPETSDDKYRIAA